MLYHKPANQNERIFSMTNKVHGTHLMLLGFFIFVGDLSLIKFCLRYLKYFTFSMLLINLKWTFFHALFTNAYSLIYNQIVSFAFINTASVAFFKPVSILSQAMNICYSKVVYCLHVHVILPLAFSFLSKCTIYFEHAHL